jgi:hypothetical protein
MPKGRRGEKPQQDAIEKTIEAAIKVAMISTGEIKEAIDPKSAAAELGRRGGKARASRLTPEERKEIARKAARKRWENRRNRST